jgi:hypothetical protein
MGLERLTINASDTSLYFTGDLVVRSSAGNGAIAQSAGSTSAQLPTGVFAGCEYYNTNVARVTWSSYFPGSVGASSTIGDTIAYVITDPEMTFIVQASTNAVVGSSLVGWNIAYSSTSNGQPNTTTGRSLMVLMSSAVGANSSYAFRVVDVYSNFAPPGVNGTDNTSAGALLVVAPNSWDRRTLTGVST